MVAGPSRGVRGAELAVRVPDSTVKAAVEGGAREVDGRGELYLASEMRAPALLARLRRTVPQAVMAGLPCTRMISEGELRGGVAVSLNQGEYRRCGQSSCGCTVAGTDSAVKDGDFSVRSEGAGSEGVLMC